jgi:hypothetical protein
VTEGTKPAEVVVPKTTDEFRALLKRAHAGDETTLPVVQKMLENPAHIASFGGNLAEQVVSSFAEAMGGKNLAFREALRRKLEAMRVELLGDSPTPVERLLVERVAVCWLQVQDSELRFTQYQKDLSIRQGDYHQRRIDAANRRFLAAVKALALVRKLVLPAFQVNIARRQVNVIAPAAVTGSPVAG